MDDAQIHETVVGLVYGGVGIQYSQMCAEKNGEKINLAIAKYDLIYLKDFVSKISMTSRIRAAMSDSVDGFFDILPTMTEEEKDTLRLWAQCKLFKYVDEKCKSNEA